MNSDKNANNIKQINIIDEAKRKKCKHHSARQSTKPYSSKTYTTGDQTFNIKQFNRRSGTDFNNPSTAEAITSTVAEKPIAGISSLTSQDIDGGNSISTDIMSSEGGGLTEDANVLVSAKDQATFKLPDDIKVLSQDYIKDQIEGLAPKEPFTVGYVTPVFFGEEFSPFFVLLKCTKMVGYTGVDYIYAGKEDDKALAAEKHRFSIETSKRTNDEGVHGDKKPRSHKAADFSANYAVPNKIVMGGANSERFGKMFAWDQYLNSRHFQTLLFYPLTSTKPKVAYYLNMNPIIAAPSPNLRDYVIDFSTPWLHVSENVIRDTIIKHLKNSLASAANPTLSQSALSKLLLAVDKLDKKLEKMLETNDATSNTKSFGYVKRTETRDRFSGPAVQLKPEVRSLYTNQIYFLETNHSMRGRLDITEAKLKVRRYYIRPQNIFCANKADLLKTLLDIGDNNCSVYTLNNLDDNKEVTKLTKKDIIYYYDNGILYDKNKIKVMDYDLYIRNEENRKNIQSSNLPKETFKDIYSDRLTPQTSSLEEAFFLDFDEPDQQETEYLQEDTDETENICCICGEKISGYGNNAEPVLKGICCDACNIKFVIPKRIALMTAKHEE